MYILKCISENRSTIKFSASYTPDIHLFSLIDTKLLAFIYNHTYQYLIFIIKHKAHKKDYLLNKNQ